MSQRLPCLLVASTSSPPPARPDPADPAVAVWRDSNDAAVAYCYASDGERWIWFPEAASFRLDPGGDVTAIPEPGAQLGAVRDCFDRFVLPIALQVHGHEVLHASAVAMRRGVVVLCGVSHMGKSTLAYGLGRRGYPQWADDLVVFEPAAEAATAIALPFRPSLRSASAAYFCEQRAKGLQRRTSNGQSLKPRESVICLCLLGRIPGGAGTSVVKVNRLSPVQALLGVLPHALSFTATDAGQKRRLIEHYLAFVARTPVFEVQFRAGLERLPAVLDAIEQVARLDYEYDVRGIHP